MAVRLSRVARYAAPHGSLRHPLGRVLRGDRQRARDRVALLGLILVTRVPPPGGNRPGSGPFLAVEDAEPPAP